MCILVTIEQDPDSGLMWKRTEHMALTKKQANYFLGRVYRLLDTDDVSCLLSKLRACNGMDVHGVAYFETGHFFLDPRHSVLVAAIHEGLHMLYPDLSEAKVIAMEKQICAKMSPRQWVNLLTKLANKLSRSPTKL